MVSGGDYTDIISDGVSQYSKGYDAAITDEIIIDLYDLAQEYAPNYLYYLETDPQLKAQLITDQRLSAHPGHHLQGGRLRKTAVF